MTSMIAKRLAGALTAATLAALTTLPASAADLAASRDACVKALASTPAVTDVRGLYMALSKATPKDDFETGEAYRARIEKFAAATLPALKINPAAPIVIVSHKPLLQYDAEKQGFVAFSEYDKTYAALLGSSGRDISSEYMPAPFIDECPKDYGPECSGTVINASSTSVKGSPYTASNAFGVKVTVTPVTKYEYGVNPAFEKEPLSIEFDGGGVWAKIPETIAMPGAEAKPAAPFIRAFYCGEIAGPLVRSDTVTIPPTIQNPERLTVTTRAVVTRTLAVSIQDTRPGGKRLLLAVIGDDGGLKVQP